jgi:hypothetical protein
MALQGRDLSDGEDAELLVYLVDEEKDIYIGVRVALFATLLARRSPAKSLSYLSIAKSLRTSKWRPRRGLYRTDRKEDLDFTVHPDVRRTPKRV